MAAGVVLRPLPLDLAEALPLTQIPGETVTVPFAASEAGTLVAEREDGALLPVSVDGGAAQQRAGVEAGTHTATVSVTGQAVAVYALRFAPRRFEASTPLPPLPADRLASLPDFPVLGEESRTLDLSPSETATYLVRPPRPGLYRLESKGLLATEGTVRTRTVPSLASGVANGVGRNFLVQQYLREGDYQLSVSARGASQGRLGLALARSEVADGGYLTLGAPARHTLPAGDAVAYRFKITNPGRFQSARRGSGARVPLPSRGRRRLAGR